MKKSGNTILITGGASGIGLALAKRFYHLDNRIIIIGRNAAKLQAVRKIMPNITTYQIDLSKQQDLEQLLQTIQEHHPDINVLINNAGVQYNYDLTSEPIPYQRIDQEIAVNLSAVIKLSVMLLPLLDNKDSAIVNVTSSLAFAPKENAAVYCATKAALHSFTTTLRYQLENSGTRVFELVPPLVDTDMTAGRGKDKISPDQVAREFEKAWIRDKYHAYIGKAKLIRLLARYWPELLAKKMRANT